VSAQKDTVPEKLKKYDQKPIKAMLADAQAATPSVDLRASADLRDWCSPVEDQESIGSCTANAGVGLVEYFERRAHGKHLDASRLFLYKVTRDLLHWTGDTGAFLRTTMEALALFGTPPEEYWPYIVANYDKDPSQFCFAFAQNYQAITYYRLDPQGISRPDLLARIKTNIAAGLPSMFGFTVYQSYSQSNGNGGKFPLPTRSERVVGGHAVDAVGYDDTLKIKNATPGGNDRRAADPEFLGHRLGRRRIWMVAVRIRVEGLGDRLVVDPENRMDRHRQFRPSLTSSKATRSRDASQCLCLATSNQVCLR